MVRLRSDNDAPTDWPRSMLGPDYSLNVYGVWDHEQILLVERNASLLAGVSGRRAGRGR